MNDADGALVVFRGKGIRRIWHGEEWWYSVVDVVGILSESQDPGTYWKVLKHRLSQEGGDETVTKCNRLKLIAEDGKLRLTDCANTETLFRLIQSIPSPKAEPFKRWLARVGYERVQEIENPELAQRRMKELYRAKGYSDEWIEKRLRGIAVRDEHDRSPCTVHIIAYKIKATGFDNQVQGCLGKLPALVTNASSFKGW